VGRNCDHRHRSLALDKGQRRRIKAIRSRERGR
jgi:hypothetical protein